MDDPKNGNGDQPAEGVQTPASDAPAGDSGTPESNVPASEGEAPAEPATP